jgi:hypothetical protein
MSLYVERNYPECNKRMDNMDVRGIQNRLRKFSTDLIGVS